MTATTRGACGCWPMRVGLGSASGTETRTTLVTVQLRIRVQQYRRRCIELLT